ncbi:bifunctional phosphopantothenoylcysteine decarboxylase/phosphopantothenate--cysteine ligase CoaBC [Listeria sp. SHR_NRA_18]|uniref:bifunctional phosphopantothenoylcysteine decarboxylase/phosphopantothenate--cysteine ligase CoaBC n=1 Tax=Listeria TaxID=1637 RepID=UPI00051D26E1|nr:MULTISPECIES: bifunctional phosphopantothenoylcysteine decarboxylase/phosphopantothenate--cysteine ligase CoaBC [Listeria]KGL40928.1 phosphopantothenoylcysteine decarboxylase [Listeria newyorkensis]KGL44947.1 phosphopantothenoylcysteine decarboxylase [Listeriaceae bacterium FSL A5-0209]RQW68612.1 bifunctional phosphopantothenoylcysteine decarboxylase/phosphopantothenate--cysteine ligase CoaBC [Listeria sp. SHR_NRA_18]WAO23301.1 bifunctional phosphopantothenoylcysteine decarboxylase/phosphopa
MDGKNILLAVSGGIAVYKAVALTSKLTQAGANVKVMMTKSAQEFVPTLSFQVLSRNDVYTDTFDEKDSGVVAHIDLADWADLVIVAPATANVIGKMANGIADDMVTTTLLATEAPIWVAPAMNVHMIAHPAVVRNINQLYADGVRFIEPSEGYLACGYVGRGRLEEPERIVGHLTSFFAEKNTTLAGRKVVVTAGATMEKLDPVRYFTNHSTGKMGFAVAETAARYGAEVVLVTSSTKLAVPHGVQAVYIETAQEMYEEVMKHQDSADVFVMSAAVADYTPKVIHEHKIKKQPGDYAIEMVRTKDILAEIGQNKKAEQVVIGFAAETQNVKENALKKLHAKNADLIVANNVAQIGAGFGVDTNQVTFYGQEDAEKVFPLLSKQEVAREIIEQAARLLEEK